MKINGDIQLDPQIKDGNLIVTFEVKEGAETIIDTSSLAYRFTNRFLNSLSKQFPEHIGKVTLIGEDRDTMKAVLTIFLKAYSEFCDTAFLRDLIPVDFSRPKFGSSNPDPRSKDH